MFIKQIIYRMESIFYCLELGPYKYAFCNLFSSKKNKGSSLYLKVFSLFFALWGVILVLYLLAFGICFTFGNCNISKKNIFILCFFLFIFLAFIFEFYININLIFFRINYVFATYICSFF